MEVSPATFSVSATMALLPGRELEVSGLRSSEAVSDDTDRVGATAGQPGEREATGGIAVYCAREAGGFIGDGDVRAADGGVRWIGNGAH
jgi:hypothetical protein